MSLGRQNAKILLFACLVIAALFMFGCTGSEEAPVVEATPTPEPVIVSLEVEDFNNSSANANMPSPTPTVAPTATPMPFSHYAPTVNMTYEELVGSMDDMNTKAKDLLKDGFPDPKTYYIIVDLQWQVTMVFKRIDDGTKFGKPDYDQPVRYMICSTGNPDSEFGNETTMGTFQILIPKERFYQFINLEAAQYLTLIRSRTYFHSILYDDKKDLNSLVQDSYDDLGTKASHACIRLTVPDARWIWYNIGYGTTCEVRKGDPLDSFTGSVRAQLILPKSIAGIRLKAGTAPWTDNWTIDGVEHVLPYKYESAPIPDGYDASGKKIATPTPADGTVTNTPDPGATQAPTEIPVTPPPATDPPATW